MFGSLQCTQKGRVPLPAQVRGTAIYADDFGGVWVVAEDAQKVLYYRPQILAAIMEHQYHVALPSSSASGTVSKPATLPPACTVVYQCNSDDNDEGSVTAGPNTDRIHSLLFFCSRLRHRDHRRGDVCIVTAGGSLVFARVPQTPDDTADASSAPPYQVVHLRMPVCATASLSPSAFASGHLVLCFHDGAFTEVVRAMVVNAASPSEDLSTATEEGAYDVDAAGLFRVEGRVEAVLYDAVGNVLVTISNAGNVDAWDVGEAVDVTAQYGSLSWDCQRHGAPTCALICNAKLWVGLTSGQLLVLPFVRGICAARNCTETETKLLRGHTAPVAAITTTTVGASVWTCTANSSRVSVWEATSMRLLGSLVFPETGWVAWQPGATQVRTALWGIEAATGEPSLMEASQTLCEPAARLMGPTEMLAQRGEETLLTSYRVCWRAMTKAFHSLTYKGAAGVDALEDAAIAAAVERVGADTEGGDRTADIFPLLHRLCEAMRPLCTEGLKDERSGGEHLMKVPSLVAACFTSHQQYKDLTGRVDALLAALNAAGSPTAELTSLEDVEEEVGHLRTLVERLREQLADANAQMEKGAFCTDTEEATDHLERELDTLREALRDEHARCCELTDQLQETREEMDALSVQRDRMQALLSKSEEQVEQLQRSLSAATRAAEVTASDVSSMLEMEAQLHDSHNVVQSLSTKVDSLLREQDASQEALQAYQRKQTAAKSVLQNVLHAQNTLADGLNTLTEEVNTAIEVFWKRQRSAASTEATTELLNFIVGIIRKFEESVEKRLGDQQAWFHTLSQDLRGSLT